MLEGRFIREFVRMVRDNSSAKNITASEESVDDTERNRNGPMGGTLSILKNSHRNRISKIGRAGFAQMVDRGNGV